MNNRKVYLMNNDLLKKTSIDNSKTLIDNLGILVIQLLMFKDSLAQLEADDSVLANVTDVKLTMILVVVDPHRLHQLMVNLDKGANIKDSRDTTKFILTLTG